MILIERPCILVPLVFILFNFNFNNLWNKEIRQMHIFENKQEVVGRNSRLISFDMTRTA
jgi:hypothetical protein